MLSIVYVSSATKLFTNEELVTLLEKSRQHNEKVGITGLLLYHDGNFIQVIEGPDEAVLSLYEAIKADKRHHMVTTLGQDHVSERQFANWSMGFRDLNHLPPEDVERHKEILVDDLTPEFLIKRPTRAYTLLLSFKNAVTR